MQGGNSLFVIREMYRRWWNGTMVQSVCTEEMRKKRPLR